MIIAAGTTSQSIDVQIVDDSGLAVTGLVAATFPAVSWSLAGNTAATAISLSDLAAITSAYSSGGVKERSGGYYRLDLPNAAIANTGDVKLFGEASGKHLLCEPIVVGGPNGAAVEDANGNVPANVRALATAVVSTLAQLRYGTPGRTVWYVDPVGGNDANAGTLASPFATPLPACSGGAHPAASGDVVVIGPGTCTVGTSAMVWNDGVTVLGCGIDVTVITGTTSLTSTGCMFRPGSNSLTQDLTLQGNLTDGSFCAPWGYYQSAGQSPFTNAVIRRCKLVSFSDGFYVGTGTGQTASFTAYDCIVQTNYDTTQHTGTGTVYADYYRCNLKAVLNSGDSNRCGGLTVNSSGSTFVALVRFFGGQISIDTSAGSPATSWCVGGSNTGSNANSIIEVYGTQLKSTGTAPPNYDLLRPNGSQVNVFAATYDPAKISGTINIQKDVPVKVDGFAANTYAPIDLTNIKQATSPTTLTNITVPTVTAVTGQLTAAQIATGVWQDTTAGDFTVANSIGKSLYASGNAPGAAGGIAIVGSNMGTATSVTGSVGSVTGSVASVTGAVGSVTGNVGGNVVGSVGSVTSGVTVTTNNDKTGYALSGAGLDQIAVTDPGGIASQNTFPKMLVAVWRSIFKKSTLTASQLKYYADDGSTANATSAVSDDGTTQTKGAAS